MLVFVGTRLHLEITNTRKRAQSVHGEGIDNHFGQHLDSEERATLFAIMSKLLTANS
jgi:hypothetical protein